jgi:glutamine amidotransferase
VSNRVAIIDHGLSNLSSIGRAIEECGGIPMVTDNPADLRKANRIVLPGVGAFPAAMANLRAKGLFDALLEEVAHRPVPLLGICLGMQLLAESSTEGGENTGLGLIPGTVMKLSSASDERIPHMGWNEVRPTVDSPLFKGIAITTDFYFVHSYCLVCPEANVIARTPYCGEFVSAAAMANVMAVQFHPEKSQRAGFQLLRNFMALQ